MHSTLRRDLRGTSKVLQTVRTRYTNRPCIRSRKFTSGTCLYSQPASRADGASGSAPTSTSQSSSSDTNSSSSVSAQGLGADLERWLQAQSEQGRVFESISEKDEHGKQRLLPHIRQQLEKLGSLSNSNGQGGLEIKDGRIRPLNPTELEQENNSASSRETNDNVKFRSSSDEKDLTSQSSSDANTTNNRQNANDQEQTSQQSTIGDGAPLTIDNNIVSRFHGSSAARRQRDRQSRVREKVQAIALPEWFQERNVLLWLEHRPHSLVPYDLNAFANMQDLIATSPKPLSVSAESKLKDLYASLQKYEQPPYSLGMPKLSEPPGKDSLDANAAADKDLATPSDTEASEPQNNTKPSDPPALPRNEGPSIQAIPNSNRRYNIHKDQIEELMLTARGRLRLPVASPSNRNKAGGIRSHILVHYTAQDADLLLDHLIEHMSKVLRCNLITLDAQDISTLISRADIDPMMADEAKTMSYEIYGDIYNGGVKEGEESSMFSEEMDDADEDGPQGPQGIPFMVGKPITIDLKALFGPKSRRGDSPFISKTMLPDMMGRSSMTKPLPHIFQSLVDSILSSPSSKPTPGDTNRVQTEHPSVREALSSGTTSQMGTIVHVKDLKAIQETNVGKHFLSQLYDQVEQRRSNGEAIMLVGTSCERSGTSQYDKERIENLQVSEHDEISSTIVITPAYSRSVSDPDSEAGIRNELQRTVIPSDDRKKRIQVINARHLYEMLQSKDVSLDKLTEGFWGKNFTLKLSSRDEVELGKTYWSFSYVQRLAAILASSQLSESKSPIYDAAQIIERSDRLKYNWAKQTQTDKSKTRRKSKGSSDQEKDKIAQVRATATKYEKRLLSGVVEADKIGTTFKDIHIPPETVDALQTLTTLSLVRPDAFKYGVLASDRIPGLLLYGPPGTGKTLAAKAVARESGATMLEVSGADINDKYVGEGEKNVQALFSLAKKLSPCIVFLDEADAMFSARSNENRRVSHRELLNQFLKEWDGMNNDSGSAFIMVATNRPMDLDDAVLRRLPRRLLVDLPTEKDRLEVLKIHLRQEHLADDVDLAKMAANTQFYSGSDLKNVAVAAALSCVRAENELAKKHTGGEPYKYPEKRTLTAKHFEAALEEISASISEDMSSLRAIKKFDEQFGDKKGRKRRSPRFGFKTPEEANVVLDTVQVRSL